MSTIDDRIASLPPEKRRALEMLLEKGAGARKNPTIERRDPALPAPLSFAQQRLWFLEQLIPDRSLPLYKIPIIWRVVGPLDTAAARWVVNTIVARHEALRTSFPTVDGQPIQAIRPSMTLDLPLVDLRDLPDAERAGESRRLATEALNHPFDLARGPLVQASLLQLGDAEHVLVVVMHHAVSDGWSVGTFTNEFAALYRSYITGSPAAPPELPVQYADFAVWQRDRLQGEVLEGQLSYWRRQLTGAPATLAIPTDRPRPAVQTFRGTNAYFLLPAALTGPLKALSRREGGTLFMTLLAAFQVLLQRYSGQDDICVGTPIAGRNRVETEDLIGFFVNTLVLRADLSGNPPFSELLRRVRDVCEGAYAHQDLPFEKLVEDLHPQRDLSHNPLFQILFGFHNVPKTRLELPGLTVGRFDMGNSHQSSRFDLAFDVREQADGLGCVIEYSTDLFDPPTIERMCRHFQSLLEGIAADPDCRISALPLLTEDERQQMLVAWNDTGRDYGRGQCMHAVFEAHAARRPDADAVSYQGRRMTYGELNRRANQLAHHLRTLGVGPEVRVGIYVERSFDMIVGMLGILKAGGAYVPLDPQYPPERLAWMLEDTQVRVLITQQSIYDLRFTIYDLPGSPSIVNLKSEIVNLDADWETIARQPETNPDSEVTDEHLAYVIFTSGSTGRPKGVQVCHRTVINLLAAGHAQLGFDERDVWTVVHSYAFDYSVWEIWGCLLHGGRLVVMPLEIIQSPSSFYDLLCAEQVTILHQTPSAIRPLVRVKDEAPEGARLTLRLVACGAEALPRELASQLLAWGVSLWNLYGPTEATVWTALKAVEPADLRYDTIPIGPPLANYQMYILDAHAHPVPIGVAGELHIGGAGLARGYHNRPDLTAEKFIPNPFTKEKGKRKKAKTDDTEQSDLLPFTFYLLPSGERLYRTGDLARYLPTGAIEYLGRIDHQVKLRGFRIELGEIEAVLREHPDVRETVVIAREDVPGDKRLVAYVVPVFEDGGWKIEDGGLGATGGPSSILHPLSSILNDLRAFLKQKLPEYMVPSAFVFLEAMPLSPNGKVDRKALPAPGGARPELEAAYIAPRTTLERTIAAIWQEVLRVEQVGVDDTFFDLGGHSLLMVQVQNRLREALGREISLIEMFRHPTVGTLARYFSVDQAQEPQVSQHSQARVQARQDSAGRRQQTMLQRKQSRQQRRAGNGRQGEDDE